MTHFLTKTFKKTYIFFFLLLFFLPRVVFSQEDDEQKSYDTFVTQWLSECSVNAQNEEICQLERALFLDEEMQQQLAGMIVRYNKSSKLSELILVSPLGTVVQEGVIIGFDSQINPDNRIPFIVCQPFGCVSQVPLDENLLNDIKRSTSLFLNYLTVNEGMMTIKFDLLGFTSAFNQL